LQKFLNDDALGLFEIDEATGEPIIDPSTGKPKLIDPKNSATVFVDVTAYNSKNYYVQGAVLLPGKLPVTGMDTVLDAINYSAGLTSWADHQGVVVYRQTRKGEPPQALHVDIDQIIMGDDLSTNYQLLPGDRLVVPNNPNYKAALVDSGTEPRQQATRQRSAPTLYFARPPDDSETSKERAAPGRDLPAVNNAQLRRVEARLSAVEQKLDQILEALKKHNP
jgi:polysaccharide biosynthesis/export protein